MWETLFATAAAFVVFGGAVLLMALGVVIGGRRLRGSCGGTGEACSCNPISARFCSTRREREASRSAS